MILVTSDQMRQFDKHTIHSRYVPGIVLMEHAGKAVADKVSQRNFGRVCVLCGKGNNGGDGWIAARWLKRRGMDVTVYSMVAPDTLVGDALQAFQMAEAVGVPFEIADDSRTNGTLRVLPEAAVYVDALLGTGTTRPLQGFLKRVVDDVNVSGAWIIAVDVPTGVNGTTGEVLGSGIRADVTICMGAQKLGTAIAPGCYYSGSVEVADIGIDLPQDVGVSTLAQTVDEEWVGHRWPRRGLDSHKGTFGRLAVAVGSMHGAPILAGLGAARSGTGLVIMALSDSRPSVIQAPLEFVLRPDATAAAALQDCAALVVGPGLGSDAPQWEQVIRDWDNVGVVDADGLLPALQRGPLSDKWVLTPHPKECARVLGWTTKDVQERRAEAAQTLAKQSGAIVVLKGYHSLIAAPDTPLLVNLTGNEALATAGTGDVLAGIIGGLLAQGLSPRNAAAIGAWLHGRAGELAGNRLSNVSVLASDVVENISRAICLHFDK